MTPHDFAFFMQEKLFLFLELLTAVQFLETEYLKGGHCVNDFRDWNVCVEMYMWSTLQRKLQIFLVTSASPETLRLSSFSVPATLDL
jgi:hypothetical protein